MTDLGRELIDAYRKVAAPTEQERAALRDRIRADRRPVRPAFGPVVAAIAVAAAIAIVWVMLRSDQLSSRGQRMEPEAAAYDRKAPELTPAPARAPKPSAGHVSPDSPPKPAPEAAENDEPADVTTGPGSAPSKRRNGKTEGPREDSLAAEMRLMKRARGHLEAGRAKAALDELEAHAHGFPKGSMLEERRALRVLALCALGKAAQGRGEARVFVRDYPRSAYVDRVRGACR